MANKEEIRALLLAGRWEDAGRAAAADYRVMRVLLGMLYEADDCLHWLAAEAIGVAGGIMAGTELEKAREYIRRLLWNLNEESGGTPWGSTEAIGAIVAARPDLLANYISIVHQFQEDDSLCPGVIWMLAMVGRKQPSLVEEYFSFITACLTRPDARVRGFAAWAAGALGIGEAIPHLARLTNDQAAFNLYTGGGQCESITVGEAAKQSLSALSGR